MQVMPATAKELGIEDITDPIESIRGGTTYLNQIFDRFSDVPDTINRTKFTLAAFNCGYGHVRDAQLLAEANNLDPMIWENNVEKMLLALRLPKNYNKDFIKYGYVRGYEPVTYVRQIYERYQHYKKFITEDDKELVE